MRSRFIVLPVAGLAMATLLAACSSGSSSSSTANSSGSAGISSPASSAAPVGSAAPVSPASSAAASSPPVTGGDPSAQIKANWEAFFGPKTTAAQKVALLQDGQHFAQTISAQQSLFQAVGATVTGVTVSGTTAVVTYDLSFGGKPVMSGQKGSAVLQDGVWKVGDASLCSLLTLQNGGKPPAVCASVSG